MLRQLSHRVNFIRLKPSTTVNMFRWCSTEAPDLLSDSFTDVDPIPYESPTIQPSSSSNGDDLFDTPVSFEDVSRAHFRIKRGVKLTHCDYSSDLSDMTGATVYLKKDFMQASGSFKERGARNALLLLSEEQKKHGVVAASAGNHALALGYHGRDLDVPVTCVMPTTAPVAKVAVDMV